ncbi:hypothetical protein B0H10DRAFT_2141123 [Mycena sp. CBHHK59/15]|nr:hypothetical protein B0H10DRAFT_2141123 [Mycena sp. CBHHK59/15]
MERPYVAADFAGLKRKDLVNLIESQLAKWPRPRGQLSKANMNEMQEILLNPKLGFTTTKPAFGNQQEMPRPDGSPSPNRVEPNVDLTNTSNLQHIPDPLKAIQLLIDDRRSSFGPTNTSQRILVAMVDSKECEEGEWRANAAEILEALQMSLSKIQGKGRIGVPDRLDHKYTENFVDLDPNEDVQAVKSNPTYLVIPKDSRLNLRVDRTLQTIHDKSSPSPDPAVGLKSLITPPTAPVSPAATRIRQPTARQITWLKDKIKSHAGYEKFQANQGKILQNIDRVQYWQFAAEVSATFYQKPRPAEMSQGKTITKAAIKDALNLGRTSLSEAINMARIISVYTGNGPHRSNEVILEITKSEEAETPGAEALKAFLQKWENDHPTTDTES